MWDVVVLTACDDEQRLAFEALLEWRNITVVGSGATDDTTTVFRTYADWPRGEKIGSGGATLLVLDQLHKEFGDLLFLKRVLILNAGGYSQRQPNASVLGKIFTVLPKTPTNYQKGWPYTMLDLKLTMYLPFLQKMPPGVFIAAADALESFRLEQKDFHRWFFNHTGFTVLAHPSTLETAVNHGVYILDKTAQLLLNQSDHNCSATNATVIRVLQKPSKELLKSSGAVIQNDLAFTDSAFFFASDVTRELLKLSERLKPVTCELNIYGDFLMPLGTQATPDYFASSENLVRSDKADELHRCRSELYNSLQQFGITAMVLPQSRFYHIGTTKEYLQNCCESKVFRDAFQLDDSTVIASQITHSESVISQKCLIEFCDLKGKVSIPDHSILSNCAFSGNFSLDRPVYLQTIALNNGLFVTVLLGTFDNPKLSGVQMQLLGFSLIDRVTSCFCLQVDKVSCSLWSLPLYPSSPDMEGSFAVALRMMDALISGTQLDVRSLSCDQKLYSIADCLNGKDFCKMINYRKRLTGADCVSR